MLRARVLLLLLLLLFVHAGVCCVASMVRTYVMFQIRMYLVSAPGISRQKSIRTYGMFQRRMYLVSAGTNLYIRTLCSARGRTRLTTVTSISCRLFRPLFIFFVSFRHLSACVRFPRASVSCLYFSLHFSYSTADG